MLHYISNLLTYKKSPMKQLGRICMLSSLSFLKIIFNKKCPILLRVHIVVLQITSILLWFDHNASSNLIRISDIFLANMLLFHCIYRFYKFKYFWENADIVFLFILNLINFKLKRAYIAYDLTFVILHSIFHFRASYCINNLIDYNY